VTLPYPYPGVLSPRAATEHAGTIDGLDTRWWEFDAERGAKTIVFVHGFRGDHHGLQLIADALPEFRVLIPDLPGFGSSAVWPNGPTGIGDYGRWLRAFLDETDTTRSVVLGHSFGSIVVSSALTGKRTTPIVLVNPISQNALAGPKRIESAVANAWYGIGKALPESLGNRWLSAPIFVRAMSVLLVKTPNQRIRRWVHEQHALYFSRYADRDSLIRSYGVSTSSTVADFAKDITAPTLLIAADRDDVTPLEAQFAIQPQFLDAQLIVLDGVGHLVHYEKPIEAAAAIREFLATTR